MRFAGGVPKQEVSENQQRKAASSRRPGRNNVMNAGSKVNDPSNHDEDVSVGGYPKRYVSDNHQRKTPSLQQPGRSEQSRSDVRMSKATTYDLLKL